MPEIKVLNMAGENVGTMTLSDAVFAADINGAVLHAAVSRRELQSFTSDKPSSNAESALSRGAFPLSSILTISSSLAIAVSNDISCFSSILFSLLRCSVTVRHYYINGTAYRAAYCFKFDFISD